MMNAKKITQKNKDFLNECAFSVHAFSFICCVVNSDV